MAKYDTKPINKMSKYDTKPINYEGCHPVIAEHLKRGEAILCKVTTGFCQSPSPAVYIVAFHHGTERPYSTSNFSHFLNAKPIIKKEKYLKKASEIVKWLEDNDYYVTSNGSWINNNPEMWAFSSGMFTLCDKPLSNIKGRWGFMPEWIEER